MPLTGEHPSAFTLGAPPAVQDAGDAVGHPRPFGRGQDRCGLPEHRIGARSKGRRCDGRAPCGSRAVGVGGVVISGHARMIGTVGRGLDRLGMGLDNPLGARPGGRLGRPPASALGADSPRSGLSSGVGR